MNSYQEFKITLAQDLVTPLQNINEEILPNDNPGTIIDKVFESTIYALKYTRSTLSTEDMIKAAKMLKESKHIFAFGLGNSGAIALDLHHKLMRLGLHTTAFTDSHLQAIAATNSKPGDTIFAISHSGSSIDIVDSAKIGKMNGANVISLTNIGISPLSEIADIALHTASRETKYRIVAISSRIAQMQIIDCLYTLIAFTYPALAKNFHAIEKALDKKKY